VKVFGRVFLYCLLGVFLIFYLFPVFWIFQISVKMPKEALASPPIWLFIPTAKNYVALASSGFLKSVMNSMIAATVPTFLALLIGAPAAYGLARLRTKRKEDISFYILSTRMVPPITILFFYYLIFTKLGLIDTLSGLVIIYLAIDLPLAIWLLKGFFEEVPQEVDEAAMIDGCGRIQILIRVVLPLVKSGLIVTALLCILFNWSEFLFALTLTDLDARTAPVAIFQFLAFGRIQWGLLSSAGIVTLLPVVVILFVIRKYLVRGMTLGITK